MIDKAATFAATRTGETSKVVAAFVEKLVAMNRP
jgi:hypothetical protein